MTTSTHIHGVTSIKVGKIRERDGIRSRLMVMRAKDMKVEFILFATAPDPACLQVEFVDQEFPE